MRVIFLTDQGLGRGAVIDDAFEMAVLKSYDYDLFLHSSKGRSRTLLTQDRQD